MRCLYLWLLLFFSGILFSQPDEVYVIRDAKEPVRISKYFLFFEDEANQEDIHTVLQSNGFKKVTIDVPNFNVTKATIWARIKLTTTQNSDWYISVDPSSYNGVTLYQKKSHGEWAEKTIGNTVPAANRDIRLSHFLFKIDLQAGDTTMLLLKIRDYFPISADIKAGTLEAVVGSYHNADMYNALCFGIMLMMLIYNLFLFISNKTTVYLYYVFYVLFSMIFTSILSGYAYHFPNLLTKFCYRIPMIPPAFFGIFGMLFTLRFFSNVLSPAFKRGIYIFIGIAVADTLLSVFLKHLAFMIIQPLGILLGILSITAAIIAMRKKHTSAKYYLIGFGAYMISLFYIIFASLGVVPINSFTWCVLITGSVIECIMLSFALGDKFRLAQREKEKAQMESLVAAKENERLVKEQNNILEQKVRERTLELQKQKEQIEQQKEEIEEKQKEILDSIHYAKHIQTALLPPEKQIDKMLRRNQIFEKKK